MFRYVYVDLILCVSNWQSSNIDFTTTEVSIYGF